VARPLGTAPGDPLAVVASELLVRYLDAWTPEALHSAKPITYAATGADGSVVAALRVFGEFADRLAGRRLAVVVAAPNPESARTLRARLHAVLAEFGAPPELTVHTAATELLPALAEQDALRGVLFAHLDGTAAPPEDAALVALGQHPGTELLLALDPATAGAPAVALVERYRDLLRGAGLPGVVHVELVDRAGRSRLLVFATGRDKRLGRFKDELWAVDEFAGVRYRDPRDPEQTLLDISLAPDIGPLRRAVLRMLADGEPRAVAQLRRFALAETLYRPADVDRLLPVLLRSGVLVRTPEGGRISPQTLVAARR
jgi:hypothetical protein